MTSNDPRRGILLMIATTLIFAMQDGLSRHLAESSNVMMVVLVRYWFFAVFVIALSARRPGGLRAAARTSQPVLQIFRGVLLVVEVCVMVTAFTLLGMIEAHAVFACAPLLVAALSGLVLGEAVGWRRRIAIALGFLGVLLILRPGLDVFQPAALLALLAAFLFALYGLLTRFAARADTAATSFFYTGVAGAAAITLVGPFWWQNFETPTDWALMGCLCITGALGHFLMIKAYEAAEASTVQPFAYFHLVFGVAIGLFVFGESMHPLTALGTLIIVMSGLYTFWREQMQRRAA